MKKLSDAQSFSIRISSAELYRRILLLLYRQKSLEIQTLSEETGIEISELASALASLEKRGLIQKLSSSETEDQRSFSLRTSENCVIGLDLGGTKLYGALCDLAGEILYEKEIVNHGKSGEECYQMLEGAIDELIAQAHRRGNQLLGIGVAVPGSARLETGVVINAPAVGMKEFPLKERLFARFGYPVSIDNDLKQASLGEAWFGAGKNHRHVVLLAIGTGIAAGVVFDGVPQRGAHLRLGELGWMVPGREFLGRKYVGFGALETEASGPGIENRARKYLLEIGGSAAAGDTSGAAVFASAKNGKDWAEKCVAETVDYLAILVANIMAFYDPDVIILGGGVSRASDQLIPPMLKLVEGCVLTQPNVVVSSLGYKAGALGAIINLTRNCPELFKG